ncbi:uncharacterized protein Bfra_007275 [Botrytis fragariae]|uniref:Uncharacterized protein n=1 Tax=Botrytis fragariae TaxID=1964551 RepID=A0A8H6EDM7_9HELO|nr:uncharacterized protein Bfra_007275 [Botrytis fragariae]KAF5868080.1 hypothetical protein Bfra_007275 [Botrytis fragariae]
MIICGPGPIEEKLPGTIGRIRNHEDRSILEIQQQRHTATEIKNLIQNFQVILKIDSSSGNISLNIASVGFSGVRSSSLGTAKSSASAD